MNVVFVVLALGTLQAFGAEFGLNSLRADDPDNLWRVVNGKDADKGQHPWQISLQIKTIDGLISLCGGAILNKNFVITAAACVFDPVSENYVIIAGEHNSEINDGTEQRLNVSQIIKHEDHNPVTHNNDIALLRLSTAIEFNQYVKAINIAISSPEDDTDCVSSGWGTLENHGSLSKILQYVNLPIINHDLCAKAYHQLNSVSDAMLCAGIMEGGKGLCYGDSGSPLVCTMGNAPTLVGVMSWSAGCGEHGFPDVFTSVSYYNSWITSHIRQ